MLGVLARLGRRSGDASIVRGSRGSCRVDEPGNAARSRVTLPTLGTLPKVSTLATVSILAMGVGGCVRPWERGALTHRSMEPDQLCEVMVGDFTEHTYDIREGATGGLGRPGGGCGCN